MWVISSRYIKHTQALGHMNTTSASEIRGDFGRPSMGGLLLLWGDSDRSRVGGPCSVLPKCQLWGKGMVKIFCHRGDRRPSFTLSIQPITKHPCYTVQRQRQHQLLSSLEISSRGQVIQLALEFAVCLSFADLFEHLQCFSKHRANLTSGNKP